MKPWSALRVVSSLVSSLVLGLAAVASTASCGATAATSIGNGDGGSGGGAGGGDGGALGDGSADSALGHDGGPPTGDSFACGSTTCSGSQYCLSPCCGGPAPQCTETDDAGACPPGFHPGNCTGGLQGGCEADPCKPAPSRCVDDPNATPGCKPTKGSRDLLCVCA